MEIGGSFGKKSNGGGREGREGERGKDPGKREEEKKNEGRKEGRKDVAKISRPPAAAAFRNEERE